MRISDGARLLGLKPEGGDGGNYELLDLFTTQGGSWEADSRPYSVPGWAREAYLRPGGAADYFDDGGADHHLFARVVDEAGVAVATKIRFWSGPGVDEQLTRSTGEKKSGWISHPIWASFVPLRGERGAWAWGPVGADAVTGGGLPANVHVSAFAVWRKRAQPVAAPWPGVVVAERGLNLRAAPGGHGQVLLLLAQGVPLEVLGGVGEWLQVQVAGNKGWVHGEFVTRDEREPQLVRARLLVLAQSGLYQDLSVEVNGK